MFCSWPLQIRNFVKPQQLLDLVEAKHLRRELIDSPFVQHRFSQLPDDVPGGQQRAHRIDDNFKAELLQLIRRQNRSDAAGQHVSELRKRDIPGHASQFVR